MPGPSGPRHPGPPPGIVSRACDHYHIDSYRRLDNYSLARFARPRSHCLANEPTTVLLHFVTFYLV